MAKVLNYANGLPRHTATGQTLYVRMPCSAKASPGHIHCELCRREAGGYFTRQPRVVEKGGGLF